MENKPLPETPEVCVKQIGEYLLRIEKHEKRQRNEFRFLILLMVVMAYLFVVIPGQRRMEINSKINNKIDSVRLEHKKISKDIKEVKTLLEK